MKTLIALMTFIFMTGLTTAANANSSTQSTEFQSSEAQTTSSEVYAEVGSKVDGVDFNSWEVDFNQSLKNHNTKCEGKNCQFKNKQAFDPSWDL